MVAHAIQALGLETEFADDGEKGVQLALQNPPDIIICDVMMPVLNGYDVVRHLRRDARFAHTPILFLTAQAEITDKLAAFEAGADDHLTKPFEPAELVARINVLLRRGESIKTLQTRTNVSRSQQARIIAIHSLRGGVGCSSMAINLGIALADVEPGRMVMVADLVLTAGQIALMLNAPLKRTWADIAHIIPQELDWEVVQTIIGRHDSGIHWVAAPTYPSEAERISLELLREAFQLLRSNYDHIVVDLPHDFSSLTLEILDAAAGIVVPMAPELASVRAAVAAIDTYARLGYPDDKIHLALNYTFEQKALPRKKIETALNHAFDIVLPFAPDLFVEAINVGRPIAASKPNTKEAETMRYLANRLG
jgi:pilus assembly protein CpaE